MRDGAVLDVRIDGPRRVHVFAPRHRIRVRFEIGGRIQGRIREEFGKSHSVRRGRMYMYGGVSRRQRQIHGAEKTRGAHVGARDRRRERRARFGLPYTA